VRWRILFAALASLGALAAQQVAPVLPEQPYEYELPYPGLLPAERTRGAVSVENLQLEQALAATRLLRRDHLATLGRVLFYDRALSRHRNRSCGSCHQQQHGFADGRPHSRGNGGRRTRRHTMSLVNLAYYDGPFFWDGREQHLEQAVLRPIEDPIEMGLKRGQLVERVRAAPYYAPLFDAAFGTQRVTRARIGTALAAFVRAIASFDTRYDAGLSDAMDTSVPFANFEQAENRGKLVYRQHCMTCHVTYGDGHPGTRFTRLFQSGGMVNTGLEQRAFRSPSLRNVAVTAPYMHDGRFRTLEQVVEFYAHRVRPTRELSVFLKEGGRWGVPRRMAFGEPSAIVGRSVGLPIDADQRRDLVAFLRTLTDEALLRDQRFADPFVRRTGAR